MKYIICLDGVKKDNSCSIEEMFDKVITENAEINYKEPILIEPEYSAIPNVFKSYDKWPKCTNLKCWYCDFNFNTVPCFIPKYITKNSIDVYGNFCSFNCATAYIKQDINLNENDLSRLLKLYYIFNNKYVNNIIESPPKTIMKKYGGYLTDKEYLDTLEDLKNKHEIEVNIEKKYNCHFIEDNNIESEDYLIAAWELNP